jgi:hypothetical protein
VKIFLDFSKKDSVDYFLLNKQELQGLVQYGKINLFVIPLTSQNPYSIYGPETLAKNFSSNNSENLWPLFSEILINGTTLSSMKEKEMLSNLIYISEKNGFNISPQAIEEQSFISWFISTHNSKIDLQRKAPIILVNSKLVDPPTGINRNSIEPLREALKRAK